MHFRCFELLSIVCILNALTSFPPSDCSLDTFTSYLSSAPYPSCLCARSSACELRSPAVGAMNCPADNSRTRSLCAAPLSPVRNLLMNKNPPLSHDFREGRRKILSSDAEGSVRRCNELGARASGGLRDSSLKNPARSRGLCGCAEQVDSGAARGGNDICMHISTALWPTRGRACW